MQAISETTHIRAWHWGVAIVCAPGAELPDDLDESRPVTIGEEAIVVQVRHAQDLDRSRAENAWDWATVAFHLRVVVEPEPLERTLLADVVLPTPDGRIALGDEDGEVIVSTPTEKTRIILSAESVGDDGLDEAWIDLVPELPDLGIETLDEGLAELSADPYIPTEGTNHE